MQANELNSSYFIYMLKIALGKFFNGKYEMRWKTLMSQSKISWKEIEPMGFLSFLKKKYIPLGEPWQNCKIETWDASQRSGMRY